jgi:arylsulfatase A-like enzyme
MPNRLKTHYLSLIFGVVIVQILAFGGSMATAADKPNILVIVVDDLGYADLGVLGSEDMQTPNLDRLYADSLRLNQYYANCPVCSPTRAAILTGCYPDRVGVPGVIRTSDSNSWGYYSPIAQTLPELLQEQGYDTAAIGKWHLGLREENHPNSRGFEFFKGFLGDMMDDYYNHRRHGNNYMREGRQQIDPKGHATDLFSTWAADFVRANGTQTGRNPWFLYLAYNAPHTPIQPPADWLKKVQDRQPGLDPNRAPLVALIEHMDAGIGRVIDALRESEQYNRTAIIFTSDNGGQISVGANNGSLRDGKGSMYEGGLRIPGCIRVPGRTKPGTTTEAVCSTVDLLPTLTEMAGTVPAVGIDGVSFGPLLASPDRVWPQREIYFVRREGGARYSGLTIQAVRKGSLKIVHNLPTSRFELFDLAKDPLEQDNLAEKSPKLFREMLGRLQYHVQRSGSVAWQKSDREARSLGVGK